jgi:hypothetical protein
MHVGIIATLDRRTVVVILSIPNQKKKFIAKFFMKCLYKYLDVAKIIWYHQEHTHEDGTLAHGTLYRDF